MSVIINKQVWLTILNSVALIRKKPLVITCYKVFTWELLSSHTLHLLLVCFIRIYLETTNQQAFMLTHREVK